MSVEKNPEHHRKAVQDAPRTAKEILLWELPRSILFSAIVAFVFLLFSPEFKALFSELNEPLRTVQINDPGTSPVETLTIYFVVTTLFFIPVMLIATNLIILMYGHLTNKHTDNASPDQSKDASNE